MVVPLLRLTGQPELLAHIASYLPLDDVVTLIKSHPRLRSLQDHTTGLNSFAPWRRRHERLRRVYETSLREVENRFQDQRIAEVSEPNNRQTTSSIVRGSQVTATPAEREYETVMVWLFDAFGLLARQGEQEGSGTATAMRGRMLPKLSEKALFVALDKVLLSTDWSRKFLSLPQLHSALPAMLQCLAPYAALDVVKKVASVPLATTNLHSGFVEQSASAYKVLTAYLMYTALKPEDILPILNESVPGGIYVAEEVRGDHEAALTEFFSFLATFFELWDEQQDMLQEPSDNDQIPVHVAFSPQARRMLKGRLRNWLTICFRIPKPLILLDGPSAPISGRSNTLSKRTVSCNLPSTDPPRRLRTGLKRSASWQQPCSMPSLSETALASTTGPSPSLTDEQRKIVDTNVGPGHLVKVRAFAGTGKTRTLVEYAKARPRQKMLYIAFNKSAQLDAIHKFGRNVDCKTFHSLCFEVLRSGTAAPTVSYAFFTSKKMQLPSFGGFGNKQIIELLELDQVDNIRKALTNPTAHGKPGSRRVAEHEKRFPTAVTTATVVRIGFERFCQSTATAISESCLPKKMLEDLGFEREPVLKWVKRIWKGMSEATDPYLSHDAYAKLVYLAGYGYPAGQRSEGDSLAFDQYNVIMFDEAQDANSCMASTILRQRQFTAVMIVGDPYQRIYGFRGAGNDCFDDVKYSPSYTFYLTHSFRFGDNIASVANVFLRALREKVGVNGVRKQDSVRRALELKEEFGVCARLPSAEELQVLEPEETGQYTVIFRKNISLIEYAISYAFTHPEHRIALRTSVPKKSLFITLRSAHALFHGVAAKNGPLKGWNTWGELTDHVKAEKADQSYGTTSESQMLSLVVAMENTLSDPDFLDRIEACERMVVDSADSDAANITLITAHQAKGLEWDRVVVHNDFGPDYELRDRLGKVKYYQEECNMMYVAVTRARKELIISGPVAQWLAADFGRQRVFLATKARPDSKPDCIFPHSLGEDDEPLNGPNLLASRVSLYFESYIPWGSFGVREDNKESKKVSMPQPVLLSCLACAVGLVQDKDLHGGEMIDTVWALSKIWGLDDGSGDVKMSDQGEPPVMRERKMWEEGYKHAMKEETRRVRGWAEEQDLEVELETLIMFG